MKQFTEKVKNSVYELNEKGELKQNVRNAFKAEVMKEVSELFENAGLQVFQTLKGVAVEFSNDELGSLVVVFDGVVKSRDFDALDAQNEFVEKQNEKAEKEAQKARLKAERMAEKERVKALKEKEKVTEK